MTCWWTNFKRPSRRETNLRYINAVRRHIVIIEGCYLSTFKRCVLRNICCTQAYTHSAVMRTEPLCRRNIVTTYLRTNDRIAKNTVKVNCVHEKQTERKESRKSIQHMIIMDNIESMNEGNDIDIIFTFFLFFFFNSICVYSKKVVICNLSNDM